MNPELELMRRLRKVLDSLVEGKGVAQSLVTELRSERGSGIDVARLTLLGHPLGVSMARLMADASEEVSMLASMVIWSSRGNVRLTGERGRDLSVVLERWMKVKENEKMERRVMAYRGLIASAVLGAMTAMIAGLAPLLGSFILTRETASSSGALVPAAAVLSALSSAMLGYYFGGRYFPAFVAVSMAAFAVASTAIGSLVSVPTVTLWGIK